MSHYVYVGAYAEFDFHEVKRSELRDGCPQCRVSIGDAKFCPECGTQRGKFEHLVKYGSADAFDAYEQIGERLVCNGHVGATNIYIPNWYSHNYGIKLYSDNGEEFTNIEITPDKIAEYLLEFKTDFRSDFEIMLRYYDRMRIKFGAVAYRL